MTATADDRAPTGAIRTSSPFRRFILDQPRRARHARRLRRDDGDLHRRQSARSSPTWTLYSSVLTTLPVALFLVVPLVFVVTVGEIDLSFPATMGFAAWIFALVVQAGYDPFLGIAAAIVDRHRARLPASASLVVYAGLSSLIATLGMNFMLRGADPDRHRGQVDRAGQRSARPGPTRSSRASICGVPVQIFWALAFVDLLGASSTTATASARRCMSSATIPTAPSRWASTSSACA